MTISIYFSSVPPFDTADGELSQPSRLLRSIPGEGTGESDAISTDDRILLERLGQNDQDALKSCHNTYWIPLVRYATRYIGSRALAEEVVQDVFLRLWERRQNIEIHGSLKGYLFGAVYRRTQHLIRTERRSEARDRSPQVQIEVVRPSLTGADETVRMAELAAIIQDTINALPERCRTIFFLYQEDDLTLPDIAHTLSIREATVRVQVHRAMKAIWQAVDEYLDT